MNSLDEFFDSVEADQSAHVEDVKDYALHLLSTSTMKDDVDEAVALPEGKTIKARCNVRGSEWQKDDSQPMRVFMSLVPWKYEIVEAEAQPAPTQQPAPDGQNFPF